MTLAMPDSVNVSNLPIGYPAYLGYIDGNFRTANALRSMFPGAELVLLTVTGSPVDAHGARVSPGSDAEPGDLTAARAVQWALEQLAAQVWRPVIYASIEGAQGYGMGDVTRALAAAGIPRDLVRLLSAHYGEGPHICGPASCKLSAVAMDGTQWTNDFVTRAGAVVDMSELAGDFFAGPGQSETERLVGELGIVRQGQAGAAVRTVQGLCNAREAGGAALKIDGVFGIQTLSAVKFLQSLGKVTVDGIVGPQTWPVLLGVA
jgi:Putative peptidoglycan binding domain